MRRVKCWNYFAYFLRGTYVSTLLLLLVLFLWGLVVVGQDLPNPLPNMETLSAGSYVIPMDNVHQSVFITPSPPVAPYTAFNIKSYGLVYQLLENGIPVKWVIRAGKQRDEPDFTALASQLSPVQGLPLSYDFGGGTFVIEAKTITEEASCNTDDPTGLPDIETLISNYGNQVAVFRLIGEEAVDVRYTLRFPPKVAIMEDGGFHFEHTEILGAANIPHDVLSNQDFLNTSECFTFVAQPHIEPSLVDQNYVNVLSDFVLNGGNFFAQCVGLLSYENLAFFQTTFGLENVNPNIENSNYYYLNGDLPIMQFQGNFPDNISGLTSSFGLTAGSSWNSNAYKAVVVGNNPNNNEVILSGADINGAIAGGNMFYGGGHAYNEGPIIDEYPNIPNARRILLNATFIPSNINFACAGNDVCICVGESTVLGCSNPVNGVTFSWSPAAGLSCTNCPNPIASPETTTTYTMTPSTSTCGSSQVTVTVWDDGPQALNVQADCNTSKTEYILSFDITGGDPGSYEVNGDSGSLSGSTFTSDPIVGGDDYSFEITDALGCVYYIEGSWNCCDALATISGGGEICDGASIDVSIDFEGVGPWTFVHSVDGVDQPVIITSDNPYIIEAFSSGEYSLVSVEDTDCIGNALGGVNVSKYDFGDAGHDASISICYNGDPIKMWSHMGGADRDGTFILVSGNEVGDPIDAATGYFDPYKQKTGTLVYLYSVSGQGICPDDSSFVSIEIINCPCIIPQKPEIVVGNIELCGEFDSEVVLKVKKGPNTSIRWYDSPALDNQIYKGINYSPTEPGVFYVVAINIPNDGCQSQPVILSYILNSPPEVYTIQDTILRSIEPIKLSTYGMTNNSSILSYEWTDLNDEITGSTIQSPLVFPMASNTYTIQVTDEFGCSATADVNITFVNQIYFPNAITPNYDGINDVFRPYGDGIASMDLRVYSRWGGVIFKTTAAEARAGWDGTKNGKFLNSGVYVYMAEIQYFSGETSKHSGDITLIR